jgi:hypothetical protein
LLSELGLALLGAGIGLLGSLTLARYKSTISGAALPPAAREGLAPAIAVARTPTAVQAARTAWTARTAFTDGPDIAMLVGSACVLATAIVVAWKRCPRRNLGQALQASAPTLPPAPTAQAGPAAR